MLLSSSGFLVGRRLNTTQAHLHLFSRIHTHTQARDWCETLAALIRERSITTGGGENENENENENVGRRRERCFLPKGLSLVGFYVTPERLPESAGDAEAMALGFLRAQRVGESVVALEHFSSEAIVLVLCAGSHWAFRCELDGSKCTERLPQASVAIHFPDTDGGGGGAATPLKEDIILHCAMPVKIRACLNRGGVDCVERHCRTVREEVAAVVSRLRLPDHVFFKIGDRLHGSVGGGPTLADALEGQQQPKPPMVSSSKKGGGKKKGSKGRQQPPQRRRQQAGGAANLNATDFGKVVEAKIMVRRGVNTPSSALHLSVDKPPEGGAGVVVRDYHFLCDVLCYCDGGGSMASALGGIVDALCDQLESQCDLVLGDLQSQTEIDVAAPTPQPCAFHFRPLSLPHPITVMRLMPRRWSGGTAEWDGENDGEEEASLEARRRLHRLVNLPEDRPLFRTQCRLRIGSGGGGVDEPLFNVHIGLPPSGVSGGTQHLVQGPYQYYHYLQQRFDDKGWGCAYRSLQTIASWFHLNHFTDKPVPAHGTIQQTLVDMGDKPASFVGSREWIGSMEVGYYLDQELGVTWRNVMANTGPEMAEKARELARHFDTQGTPIMMGGGQLAFTILGVDWNEATGEVKFLILDPHYTGGEDLRVIQDKPCAMEGYRATACGWRSADTFSVHTFYSCCLPQRPSAI